MGFKKNKALESMHKGGAKLAQIKKELIAAAKPGTTLNQIESLALKLIKQSGGKPSFTSVPSYSWATCLNVNEGLVHGVPTNKAIKEGDIVSVDVGLFFEGFHTDTSFSFITSNFDQKKQAKLYDDKLKFLSAGQEALDRAITQAKPSNRVGHISRAIESTIESYGYSVARNLTGHGIGKKLHQDPTIPCFLDGAISRTPILKKGMALAIEAIYLAGKSATITDQQDNWTIKSLDGKITAVFEETVVVVSDSPIILTKLI